MADKLLRYTLRIDRHLFKKFRYIAEYQGRSANKEIEYFIKQCIIAFEAKHGAIEIEEE